MTNSVTSPNGAPALIDLSASLAAGVFLDQFARGVAAFFANPFGAGPGAQACLPPYFRVGCGQVSDNCVRPDPCAPNWTVTTPQNGRANIDLGDGYTLEINERNSEVVIVNAQTAERTRIWGDPHVDGSNGQHLFDFWGTTTFTLENGTKITINTERWGGSDMFVASQLVITKGSNAIVVDGVSQNQLGDLSVTMNQNGRALDRATPDGYRLLENPSGEGWLSAYTGRVATQADLNATRPGAIGPVNWDEVRPWSVNFGLMLSSYLLGGIISDSLLAGVSADAGVRLSLAARVALR